MHSTDSRQCGRVRTYDDECGQVLPRQPAQQQRAWPRFIACAPTWLLWGGCPAEIQSNADVRWCLAWVHAAPRRQALDPQHAVPRSVHRSGEHPALDQGRAFPIACMRKICRLGSHPALPYPTSASLLPQPTLQPNPAQFTTANDLGHDLLPACVWPGAKFASACS